MVVIKSHKTLYDLEVGGFLPRRHDYMTIENSEKMYASVKNKASGGEVPSGVVRFLSKRPNFLARHFTCAPDRARKKWVLKTKMHTRSRHN